jgi:hypothetical protein
MPSPKSERKQQGVDSDYLFGSFLELPSFLHGRQFATAVGARLENTEVREDLETEHRVGSGL